MLTQCTTSAARDEDGRLSRSWIAARCVGARMSELVATALVSGGVRLESGALRSGAPTYSPVDMGKPAATTLTQKKTRSQVTHLTLSSSPILLT